MELHNKIKDCYTSAKTYPELVKALIRIGVLSYTVDVSSGSMLYRFAEGENAVHAGETALRAISDTFDTDGTVRAIKDNQQGKTTFPQFMDGIATAGVRFYEATLNGDRKRVIYIGSGGYYEELIPV